MKIAIKTALWLGITGFLGWIVWVGICAGVVILSHVIEKVAQ